MKLSIDSSTISDIKNILNGTTTEHELEFRLGHFEKTRDGKRFVPGVSKSIFKKLLKLLSEKTKYTTTNSYVQYYDNDIRKVDGLIQKKIRIAYKDIAFVKIGVRLSKSIEKTISEEPIGNVKFSRKRTRYSFSFEGFLIDLTSIDTNGTISYEVEIEFNKVPSGLEHLIHPLKYILELAYSDNHVYLIQEEEQLQVIDIYNNLFSDFIKRKNINLQPGKMVRFENKPRNIKRKDISFMTNYSATNKLEGVSYFLIICRRGIYILNQTDIDKLHNQPIPEYEGTLLHGEWFEGGFYIFDVIRFKGEDITLKTHPQRLSYAEQVLPLLSKILEGGILTTIKIKTFIYSGNLEDDTKNIVRDMYNTYGSNSLMFNDGIIYTPVDLPYINNDTLKFKFPWYMTIDFYIDNKHQNGDDINFDVKVYDKNNNLVLFDKTFKHKINPVLQVSKNNSLYGKLENGMIVESQYDKNSNTFIPFRIRDDKDRPNFIGVASDVFNDMINPLGLDELVKLFHDNRQTKKEEEKKEEKKEEKNTCLLEMRKFHNYKKKELILQYTKDKTVLDLGFGRGGDIHKYSEADVKYIWGVEPNKDNYEEAKKRLSVKKDLLKKVKIIPLKAQETSDILDQMKDDDGNDQRADVVASFFSLTFFFENEHELDRLVNTIAGTIKKGGFFIGTTMDGEKTYEFLKGKKEIDVEECYKIIKYYEDDDNLTLGKKLLIHLQDTIVSEQYEWLAIFDILKTKLEKRGVYLVSTSFFEPPSSVDPKAANLSKLFRSFVFERRETEAERLSRERAEAERAIALAERENRLKMAPLDKTLFFTNKIDENTELVRTGTVGEGSCFYHSVLRAIDSNYVKLSEKERKILVSELRKKMASELTKEKWLKLANGSLAYGLIVPRFTKWVKQQKIQEATKVIDKIIKNDISEFLAALISLTPENENKKLSHAFNVITDRAFNEFKETLTRCDAWVGYGPGSVDAFEYISDTFNIDIYIIRDSTRKPYRSGTDCSARYKNRKSIIILWVGESHYEVVGRLEGKKVIRVFEPDDPLIRKINSFVC